MKISRSGNFAVVLALTTSFVACTGAQRASLLPPAMIVQSACHAPAQAGSRNSHVQPDIDEIVWKPCIHNGDHCTCAYNMSNKPPSLDVYACEGGSYAAFGLAATPKLMYAGFNSSVLVFAGKKRVATLEGLTGDPVGLAVDHFGNVWATNSPSATISEFGGGATKPTATYTDSNLTSASYLAVDAAGDVYVEGQAAYSIEVDVLPAGGTTFTPIGEPGKVGLTAGGLAVQNAGTKAYLWINDQGTAGSPAAISRYFSKGRSLSLTGSFKYSGVDEAIWADPAGKHLSRVFAINNVADGSEYASSAVEYAMPGGKIVNATAASISSTEAVGIAGAYK